VGSQNLTLACLQKKKKGREGGTGDNISSKTGTRVKSCRSPRIENPRQGKKDHQLLKQKVLEKGLCNVRFEKITSNYSGEEQGEETKPE